MVQLSTTHSQPADAATPAIKPSAARPLAQPMLHDARYEHDSCGVGFVAMRDGAASHTIVEHALTALARLAHRGAVAVDGRTSDGVGLLTAVPRALLLKATGVTLDDDAPLAAGMLFVPPGDVRAERELALALAAHGVEVLAWRDVPVRTSVLGEISLETMPVIRQVLATDAIGEGSAADTNYLPLETRLYHARKAFERKVEAGETAAYICSLSTQTIVYKAMCLGRSLAEFYPDLANPLYVTPFAIFHQRYATNTTPTWHRAQPGRLIGHNGEINTVWGNRARLLARDATLPAECKPVLSSGGTDSTSLDEALELLSHNGRTLPEAVRMLLPPAIVERASPFLAYSGDCAEPWDGPAAISFSDGDIVGAALDRNGLRPCRYAITVDGLVIAGSEAGLIDLDPAHVVESGSLRPGQMFVVDMRRGRVLHDSALLDEFDAGATYATLLERAPLEPLALDPAESPLPAERLFELQRGFGFTREDTKMVLAPMAASGKDAVWSMGDDTPLAFLARAPRPFYAFFRQRFAQVTNPAIDPLREAVVVSLHTRLGPWPHLLDKGAPLPGVSLPSPFLSLGQMAALRAGAYPHARELPMVELSCICEPNQTLRDALDVLCARAVEQVREGAKILLLSDRHASAETVPVPMAMATGAVHQTLVQAGLRTLCGLAIEAGDCRDVHHVAVLIGFGAGAVCPWLMLESARAQEPDGEAATLRALDAGIAKVMSKMGISVVDSYRGAGLFDTLGLHASVVDRCFPGTPAPLSGIGLDEIERRLRLTWQPTGAAETTMVAKLDLPDYGWVRFRKAEGAEPHHWQPPAVKALQTVVGSTRGGVASDDPLAAFQIFSQGLESEGSTIRDLLAVRPAGPSLPLDEVETVASLTRRFAASAMSLGSLSPEAHSTITAGMNMLGSRSNTGEGGEDPAVYRAGYGAVGGEGGEGGGAVLHAAAHDSAGGTAVAEMIAPPALLAASAAGVSLNNRIKQVASGRFGVTAAYLAHAEEIEIKVAQGAKPGEGGQLPGHKVSGLIARLRHAQPGVPLISPPPHHDIYSIEDLAQLIYDLKRVNPRATVGVKLVSSFGVGTVAAGVAKAYADFIVIAGNTGGTGAAALSSIKYAGNPWELGLAEAQQSLVANNMRDRVRLRTDGGLATARDVLIAALLGADEFAFGTAVLVSLGCDMARQCHLNTCPVGIATQRPELRAKFRGKPEHVVRYFEQLGRDLRRLLAKYGLPSLQAATGRVDLLEQVRFDGELDLRPVLARSRRGALRWMGGRNDRPESSAPLDERWTEPALAAVRRGEPFHAQAEIRNEHRSVGARLAGELELLRARGEVADATIEFDVAGVAGQSFGAFAAHGMTLRLTGQANDFVGKGLSGGTLVLVPTGLAAEASAEHVLLGNVALYGATAGTLLAAGRAGERFAVRNSGAVAVIEGVGDHGCEYMTGGEAIVLGSVGVNFGAGMTGGVAWVWDRDGSMLDGYKRGAGRLHAEYLQPVRFADAGTEAQGKLRSRVEQHVRATGSVVGTRLLEQWSARSAEMLQLLPRPQA